MKQGFVYWKLHSIYNRYCERRLYLSVRGVKEIIEEYSKKSRSTGTKFPTLYHAVRLIQKHKPRFILESGTGVSTVVLAETLMQLKKQDKGYDPKLISMESISEWFEMAQQLLPVEYKDVVEIRLGYREKFEYAMFRGYCHSNIPTYKYEFVFLDGPSYEDDFGTSCCMDAVKVRTISNANEVHGVIDTRVSSVFVIQQIFGYSANRYFSVFRTSWFRLKKLNERPKLSSRSFCNNIIGAVRIAPNSFL